MCGLSAQEIARAFLLPEATLNQRLTRAKRKIADAGIPFEVPGPEYWPERQEAVLSTLEIKGVLERSGLEPDAVEVVVDR